MLAVLLACLEINQTPRRTDVTAIKQDRLVDELQTGTAEMVRWTGKKRVELVLYLKHTTYRMQVHKI